MLSYGSCGVNCYHALQGAGEELGLDISQVDALTLRQLQHYVRSCFAAGDGPVSWPGCLVGSGALRSKMPSLSIEALPLGRV